MHELPMVSRVLEDALDRMTVLGGTSLRRVEIRIGTQGHLTPEAAAQHFEILARDTPAARAELRVRVMPSGYRCFDCLEVFTDGCPGLSAVCPRCGGTGLLQDSGATCELGEVEICA